MKVEDADKAEFVIGGFDFEVYNGSNVTKPVKGIKALIITENNTIETELIDEFIYRQKAIRDGTARDINDYLTYINMRPKEVQVYKLRFHLSTPDFIDGKVEEIKEVRFIAKDIKNREIDVVLYKHA